MKRIPRIKFPQRHSKPSSSEAISSTLNSQKLSASKSDVPSAPGNPTKGGKASLQPKRTPISEQEIEAIMGIGEICGPEILWRWIK